MDANTCRGFESLRGAEFGCIVLYTKGQSQSCQSSLYCFQLTTSSTYITSVLRWSMWVCWPSISDRNGRCGTHFIVYLQSRLLKIEHAFFFLQFCSMCHFWLILNHQDIHNSFSPDLTAVVLCQNHLRQNCLVVSGDIALAFWMRLA